MTALEREGERRSSACTALQNTETGSGMLPSHGMSGTGAKLEGEETLEHLKNPPCAPFKIVTLARSPLTCSDFESCLWTPSKFSVLAC